MQRDDSQHASRLADELLVVRCQLGERDAFDALVRRWAGPISGYAGRVTGDADGAAELTQDVWLRVVRGIGRIEDTSRFRSWLFGIAHRAFADQLRRKYRAAMPLPAEDDVDAGESEAAFDVEAVERGLARLAPVEREILTLFYLEELAIDEVATALSIPTGTVKSRLHRARKQLRRALESHGDTQ
ncbi:sigma-70 family RNA polymerase sigma factor [Sphingomonas suaedae]|uniref:Sigma-70 family RNA polymerase sigma factor n=1 Tax=Sphingomonas suaedae TaxID=2599297 RepID=A0A518RB46_9SPHN|nr:sigma-70 family RNA polymerase sigma factor [Sphingomonas suaedae]QDX24664.1 sigma-70 family RNA polymerase sigma factor [Sphingomonas suaedae]